MVKSCAWPHELIIIIIIFFFFNKRSSKRSSTTKEVHPLKAWVEGILGGRSRMYLRVRVLNS